MGQFSWFTQDTHHRIINDEDYTVYMVDDKGNKYREDCYEGYGVFGGKDYYELMAEMNGYTLEGCGGDKELLRLAGIGLAFDDDNYGYSSKHKHPSITENGKYYNGAPPESDPEQGWESF